MKRQFNFGAAGDQVALLRGRTGVLNNLIYHGKERWIGDPNTTVVAIAHGEVPLDPVPGAVCALTGEEAMVYQSQSLAVPLRPDILQRLVLLALTPEEFKPLYALFPAEFLLHDDFYTEEGDMMQPKIEALRLPYVPLAIRAEMAAKLAATSEAAKAVEVGVDLI